jgi:hypothetical protein
VPTADEQRFEGFLAGFCPNERVSDAVLSMRLPRGVNLCFLQGASLPDPAALLRGSGKVVRHIRLASMADFDQPAVASLIDAALARAKVPFDPSRLGRFYVKSVSPKKRPRRPPVPKPRS